MESELELKSDIEEPTSTAVDIDDLLRYVPVVKTLFKYLDGSSLKTLSAVSMDWLRCTEEAMSSRFVLSIPWYPPRKTPHSIQRYFTHVRVRGAENIKHLPLCVEHLTLENVSSDFELEKYERLVSLKTVDCVFTMETPNKSILRFETCTLKTVVGSFEPKYNLDNLTFENLEWCRLNHRFTGSTIKFVKRHPHLRSFALHTLTPPPLRLFHALRDYTKIENLGCWLKIASPEKSYSQTVLHIAHTTPYMMGSKKMKPQLPLLINEMKHLRVLEISLFDWDILKGLDFKNLHTLKCASMFSSKHTPPRPISDNIKCVSIGSAPEPTILEFLSQSFPNITDLDLGICDWYETSSQYRFPKLEKLSLKRCTTNSEVSCILAPKLKTLKLDKLFRYTVHRLVDNFPIMDELILEIEDELHFDCDFHSPLSSFMIQNETWRILRLQFKTITRSIWPIEALEYYRHHRTMDRFVVDRIGSFSGGRKYVVVSAYRRSVIYCYKPRIKPTVVPVKRRADGSCV